MKNKKKILIIVVGILLTLGIVIGVSYAWWTHTISQEGINTIQSTCLEIELEDENPITLQNAYPITDYEASLLTPYAFTIRNKCNTMLEYDMNLDIMESNNRLSSSYIAIEFNGGEKKLLNTLEEVTPTYKKEATETEEGMEAVEGRYLTSGELGANESKSYSLKLWMDESVTVSDDAMNKNFVSKVVVTAKQSHKVRLVDYVINDDETEEFEHEATYQTKALTDYRYTGSNPNNYVYFGCEDNCTEDNLYRIIGVMPTQSEIGGDYENRVKLIKAAYTDTKFTYGASANDNRWDTSPIKLWLNGDYFNALESYQTYIDSAVWYIGAFTYRNYQSTTPQGYYSLERGSNKTDAGGGLNTIAKVGLMYPSDYALSLGNKYKNDATYTNRDNYISNAWLFNSKNGNEWTISPDTDDYTGAGRLGWQIISSGVLQFGYGYYRESDKNCVRPTFYLKSNVSYQSGNGSREIPYRITINE